jgi:Tat protein secretion system quality control protein TatD with DNase activity
MAARFRTHIRAARECGKPLVIHTARGSRYPGDHA